MNELQKSDDTPDPVTWYGLVWRIVRTAIESNANLIRVCILICLAGGALWLIASVGRLEADRWLTLAGPGGRVRTAHATGTASR
jgi:hypothetical protein